MMWGVQFTYGKVRGAAVCYGSTSNPATGLDSINPTGVGVNCACKMLDVNKIDVSDASKWTPIKSYYGEGGDDTTRQIECANGCAGCPNQ